MRPGMQSTMQTPGATPGGGVDRTEVLIVRYTGILEADPRETFAFERLMNLYRERDGNVDTMVADLRRRAEADASAYAPRMLLGHLYKAQNLTAEARAAYTAAAALRPNDPVPAIALGRLERTAGDRALARTHFERALPLVREDQPRRELLQELGALALDMGDYDGASGFYRQLARGSDTGVYLRTAFARALTERGEHARAVTEYERVLTTLRGDNRVIAPVLRDMGLAQLEAGDVDGAIQTFNRALRVSGREAGVRAEIYDGMVEAYRRGDRLEELITQLEERGGRAFETLELLGRLHDELAHEEEALTAYRRALAANPRHIDTRVRVAQLLARSGRLEEVIAEYRALIRAAPREPRFVVELAQLLMQTGRRDEALRLADQTSRRYVREASVHQALAELFQRWGDEERATREVELLVRIDPRDPSHLIALGEQQLDQGDEAAAIATWRRILQVEPDRARAYAALAGVFADHAMLEQAEDAYREAVDADGENMEYRRGLASVLERPRDGESPAQRAQRDTEAITQWQALLSAGADASVERAARREARRRIVGIYSRRGTLNQQLLAWQAAFAAEPPDLEAGRYVAEAHLRARPRNVEGAESALARLIQLAPGDVESLLALERVRVAQGDLPGAIEVLQRLVDADPHRAPRYLQQMAEHAHALYRDEDAVRYAAAAVTRAPDDAEAHRRLGDLYRSRQDLDEAVASYRRAIELNDRLFTTYFELAELHLARGETDAADQLFRQVIRTSPDDELVARAARASLQLNLGSGTLERLEQDLLPLALAHAQRPIFRRLVVDLYDQMAAPLIDAATGAGAAGDEARETLRRLGTRAIKPLLEALADDDPRQRSVAIDILGHLGNPNAAGPLLAAAEDEDADTDLRARALAGAGGVAEQRLAPRFIAIVTGPERRLRGIATWGLARMGGTRAIAAMRGYVAGADRAVRAFSVLGLGRARHTASADLLRTALREDPDPNVKACAAWALGRLARAEDVPELVRALRGASRGLLPRAAAAALGDIGDPTAREALSRGLFDQEPRQRQSAASALARLGASRRDDGDDVFPVLRGQALAAVYLPMLLEAGAPPDNGAVRLAPLEASLVTAATNALQGPMERVSAALAVLTESTTQRAHLSLGPLTANLEAWPEAERERAVTALEHFAEVLRPELIRVATHPTVGVREAAVRALSVVQGDEADAALAVALDDEAPSVVREALRALARRGSGSQATDRLAQIALGHDDWSTRLAATRALARREGTEPTAALVEVLATDRYAFVREAAATGLGGGSRGAGATQALTEAMQNDPERRVREAARLALEP